MCHTSLLKITEKGQYTLIEQPVTSIEQWLICWYVMLFNKQGGTALSELLCAAESQKCSYKRICSDKQGPLIYIQNYSNRTYTCDKML